MTIDRGNRCGVCGLILALWVASTAHAQEIAPRIINGTPTDQYEAVGIVGSLSRGGFCSGTLISPVHVLTAAHCAEVIMSPTEGTFEILGQVYTTWDITIHPNYNPFTLANDIAILELSDPVLDVEPYEIFRGIPSVGDPLTIVGFGGGGTAEGGSDGSFGVKRVGTTTIQQVTSTLIRWTFDDPTEANTAPGDSGGPGFLEVLGIPQIASITSGGSEQDAGLGDRAFNTRVDAYAAWIDTVVEAGDGGDGEDGGETDETENEEYPCKPGQFQRPPTMWKPGWHHGHRPGPVTAHPWRPQTHGPQTHGPQSFRPQVNHVVPSRRPQASGMLRKPAVASQFKSTSSDRTTSLRVSVAETSPGVASRSRSRGQR